MVEPIIDPESPPSPETTPDPVVEPPLVVDPEPAIGQKLDYPVKVASPPVEPPPVEPPPVEPPPVEPPPVEPPPVEPGERVVPDAKGYKLPEWMPENYGEFANKNEFTQEQVDASITQFGEFAQTAEKGRLMQLQNLGKEHMKSWGDEAEYNLSIAQQALRQNDPDGELVKTLDSSGYGNHPAVLNFLLTIGKSMKEGGFLKSASRRQPGKKTFAQALYPNLKSTEE